MPVVLALMLLILAAPASDASTIDPWPDPLTVLADGNYAEAILLTGTGAEPAADRHAQARVTVATAIHALLLFGYALVFSACAMSAQRQRRAVRLYAPLAAWAIARMRCTIARRPLDRWADR